MKKWICYVVPAILCAVVLTVIFAGYFQYEYRMNIAYGIGAPIGVSLCFICFCVAELVCVYAKKFTAAIVLAAVKYILLFIGIFIVFRHTMYGLGFMVILGMAIPVLLPVAIAGIAIRALVFVAFFLFYVGIIAEPLILAFSKPKAVKPIEAAPAEPPATE